MCLLVAWLTAGSAGRALAQPTLTDEERLQILLEPDALTKKPQREKRKPASRSSSSGRRSLRSTCFLREGESLELRSSFELRANDEDYDGYLRTDPVMLLGNAAGIVLPA